MKKLFFKHILPYLYYSGLKNHLGSHKFPNPTILIKEMKIKKKEIESSEFSKQCLSQDKILENWIPLCSSFISAYHVLQEKHPTMKKEIVTVLQDSLLKGPLTSSMPYAFKREFKRIKDSGNSSQVIEKWLTDYTNMQYPSPHWESSSEIKKEEDGNEIVTLKIHSCFFAKYFAAHNASEIFPVYCTYDKSWYDLVEKELGWKFRRSCTLSTKGKFCEFAFSKNFEKHGCDVSMDYTQKLKDE